MRCYFHDSRLIGEGGEEGEEEDNSDSLVRPSGYPAEPKRVLYYKYHRTQKEMFHLRRKSPNLFFEQEAELGKVM